MMQLNDTVSQKIGELQNFARNLNLTSMAENLPYALLQAQEKAMSYSEFAGQLLNTEINSRIEKRITRATKMAKLGAVEDLDSFNFSIRPKLEARIIKELCSCQFVAERRNVLCLGHPGLGKTRIAKTIARSACLAGYSVVFVNTAKMLEDIQGSLADNTYHKTMHRYVKPRLLVCDEFAYERFSSDAAQFLFRLVSARYKHGSMIITANTGLQNWRNFFPSETSAILTMDRLVDGATILRFTGQGCRKPRDIHGAELENDAQPIL